MTLGVLLSLQLSHDFENSHLLRCAGLSKSTKSETENDGDVCYCYFAD